MINKILPWTALMLLSSTTGMAEVVNDVAKPAPGFYFGGALGQGSLKVDVDGFGRLLDKEKLGYKLFGGWRFNENFSLEGSWADLQTYRISDGGVTFSTHPSYFAASAIGTLPLKPNFAVFGRLGYSQWGVSAKLSDGVDTFRDSDHGNEFLWGAGILTYFEGAIVRLEYEKVGDAQTGLLEENDTHMDFELISLGVAWKF